MLLNQNIIDIIIKYMHICFNCGLILKCDYHENHFIYKYLNVICCKSCQIKYINCYYFNNIFNYCVK